MSLDWLSNAQKKDSTELSPLSANVAFLLNEGSKKKKSEEMKLYLLQSKRHCGFICIKSGPYQCG